MKPNATLVITSLLSILLLTLPVTDDVVRAISKAEASKTALLVLVACLYGTSCSLIGDPDTSSCCSWDFAAAMPIVHMGGAHYGEIARSAGGFFFVWTLWALGGLGGFTVVASARGIWRLRTRGPSP